MRVEFTPILNNTFVHFPLNQYRWICGKTGIILNSTNSGSNWAIQSFINYGNLKSLSFINNLTGWIVGQEGIILGFGVPNLVQKNKSEIITKFKLYQNYPNPFNPSTIIKYEIPYESYIKIIIFDLSGRKVNELVNREQSAGIYSLKLDYYNLSSDIYFYVMYVNNRMFDIKKMVIIR